MAAEKKKTKKKILVIVESPSKAKTIGKYLGTSIIRSLASVGHVRDLPKSKLGIDIENDFEPQYISIRGKGDLIKASEKRSERAPQRYIWQPTRTVRERQYRGIWHILLGIDPASPTAG